MWPNPQETADLVTFTEEILNGKLHFLCSVHTETLCFSISTSREGKKNSVFLAEHVSNQGLQHRCQNDVKKIVQN